MKLLTNTVLFLLIIFVSGCSTHSGQHWYKDGCGEIDFNFDRETCRRSAGEIARQATLTGNFMDSDVFLDIYTRCLYAKGWRSIPPGTSKENISPIELAKVQDETITVFKRQIRIPSGFNLTENHISTVDDVRKQTLLFKNYKKIFIKVVIQDALNQKFESIDYPVKENFIIYDKGEKRNNAETLKWTVFAGEIQGQWIAGIGAYLLLGEKQRITFTMSRNLSAPQSPPPPGLSLTKRQKLEIDFFYDTLGGPLLSGI